MQLLRQSTIQTVQFGPFIDDTDFKTPETGLTIAQADRQISKDGAVFAQSSETGNSTHDIDGFYRDALTAADTGTLGILKLQVTVAGAILVWENFLVVPAEVYDAFVSGTGNGIRGDVRTWLGSAPNALVSGRVDGSVGAMASAVLTAAAIASNAITADKIATAAFTAAKFAAGAFDAVWTVTARLLTVPWVSQRRTLIRNWPTSPPSLSSTRGPSRRPTTSTRQRTLWRT